MSEFSWYCPNCNKEKSYSALYDAFYCKDCDIWLEEKCSDPTCEFCSTRPDKPSLIN